MRRQDHGIPRSGGQQRHSRSDLRNRRFAPGHCHRQCRQYRMRRRHRRESALDLRLRSGVRQQDHHYSARGPQERGVQFHPQLRFRHLYIYSHHRPGQRHLRMQPDQQPTHTRNPSTPHQSGGSGHHRRVQSRQHCRRDSQSGKQRQPERLRRLHQGLRHRLESSLQRNQIHRRRSRRDHLV